MIDWAQIRCWPERVRAWSRAEWLAGAAILIAAPALLVLAWRLWGEWRFNPDLSHGFFAVPVVFLLWLRVRADARGAQGLSDRVQTLLILVLGPAIIASALFATVYAVGVGWDALPSLFLLGLATGGAMAAAITLAAGREVRWLAPGWAALMIPLVIVLSAPLPPATYARITLALREVVTSGVVEVLRIFGVPAVRTGNVIYLGAASVGVEDACSGVRSLVSCLLAGLVLSALMLRSPRRRAVLVLIAGPLAVLMNFLRSLALTILAGQGVDIAGAWHDWLGFGVLAATTALLAWCAAALEEESGSETPGPAARTGRAGAAGWLALACFLVAGGWVSYVAVRTEAPPLRPESVPDLAALVPAAPKSEGWTVETRQDLHFYYDALHTRHLLERSYARRGPGGEAVKFTVYVAWWPAGATAVSTVALHTPESCWPGSGWLLDASGSARLPLPLADGRVVDDAERRVFRFGETPQRVWYWHLVDGRPLRPFDPLKLREQMSLFFEHGVRYGAPQAFVRLSSNRDWAEIEGEPLVREIVENLSALGLPLHKTQAAGAAP